MKCVIKRYPIKKIIAIITLMGLAACQNYAQEAPKVSAELNAVCNTAMLLAPVSGELAPWIIGGCGSAEGLAKLAADPNSIAWVQDLIAKVKALQH